MLFLAMSMEKIYLSREEKQDGRRSYYLFHPLKFQALCYIYVSVMCNLILIAAQLSNHIWK